MLLLTHLTVEKTDAAGGWSVTDARSQRDSQQLTQSVHWSSVQRRLHVPSAQREVSKHLGLNSPSDSRNGDRGGWGRCTVIPMCSRQEQHGSDLTHVLFSARQSCWLPEPSRTHPVSRMLAAAHVKATGEGQHLCSLFLQMQE